MAAALKGVQEAQYHLLHTPQMVGGSWREKTAEQRLHIL
jgi:hypothetical protein